jgi:choice-of-anchor C domain-containing protein
MRIRNTCAALVALGGSLCLVSSAAAANLLGNGGFETPIVGATHWQNFQTGQSIGAWHVTSGDVDVVDTASFWVAARGRQSLDLSGFGPGTISQTVATTPGASYKLAFKLAGDTFAPPIIKTLNVLFNGAVVSQLSFDTTGHTPSSMGYVTKSIVLHATSTSSTIAFQSTSDSNCGPVLDNIKLVALG